MPEHQTALGKTCSAIEDFDVATGRLKVCGKPAVRLKAGEIWGADDPRAQWRCQRCFYREYLKSRRWERLRDRRITAAFKRCERCGTSAGRGKNGQPTGLNVHHLTYDRLGDELDSDLIVLCRSCHKAEHRIVE